MPYAAAKLSTGREKSARTPAPTTAPPPMPSRRASCRSSALASAISSCTSADSSVVAVATNWPRLRFAPSSAALIACSLIVISFVSAARRPDRRPGGGAPRM